MMKHEYVRVHSDLLNPLSLQSRSHLSAFRHRNALPFYFL